MNAVVLNRTLIGLIALMVGGTIAGFYFASQLLSAKALETDHIRTDASMSEDNLRKLQQLESLLATRKSSVDRTRAFVGSMQDYSYQDKVVEDLVAYAALAGPDLKVTNLTFADPTKAPQGPAPKKKPVSIPGVKVLQATATLNTPVSYTSFTRFLRAIEQNLTKMQVTGVNITPDDDNPRLISGPTIELQVYVREK